MNTEYWPGWERSLSQWGLKPLACSLLSGAQPLMPVAAQLLFLGMPLFTGLSQGNQYAALVELLGDGDQVRQFTNYLQEAEI